MRYESSELALELVCAWSCCVQPCAVLKDLFLSWVLEGYSVCLICCALLCKSHRELHHTQLWFRAKFDFDSLWTSWEKCYSLLLWNYLVLTKSSASSWQYILWPWTLPSGLSHLNNATIPITVTLTSDIETQQIWSHIQFSPHEKCVNIKYIVSSAWYILLQFT